MVAALVCVFLGAIDLTVVASILPHIISDLGVNTADIDRYIWAVNAYLIAYIVAIPLAGGISDRTGRLPAFAGSIAIFLAGSVVCALADSLTALIIGRAIQGFGGGGLLPVAIALAGDTLGRRGQLAGIGFVGAVETLGWIVGPMYGAVITESLGLGEDPWRTVFWLNVPILVLLLLGIRGVAAHDRHRSEQSSLRQVDWLGAALLTTALATLTLALASGGELGSRTGSGLRALGGTENPLADRIPLLLGIGIVAAVALVWWELRTASPLLPVRLYRSRSFVATVVANFLVGVVLMTVMVNVPIVVALGTERGSAGLASALLLAPFTIAIAVVSLGTGYLSQRFHEFVLMIVGVILAAVGSIAIAPFASDDNQWAMVPGLVLTGVGLGLLLPPLGALPIQIAGNLERGAAAASALMFRLLGMTIGVSLLTAAGVWRLQVLTNRLEPVVQADGESTASFLVRQQQFIIDHAIPLSRQVVGETLLAGGAIALVTLIPVVALKDRVDPGNEDLSPEFSGPR